MKILLHLSKPSKLGGVLSFCLPPVKTCPNMGQVCYTCYAGLGMARMTNVAEPLEANYRALNGKSASTITRLLLETIPTGIEYFRWLWSGDVFSREFAIAIWNVAQARPETKFWLPTRTAWFENMEPLPNLIVRKSSHAVNDFRMNAGNGATVALPGVKIPEYVWTCPGDCKGCKVCWEFPDALVAYPWHGSGSARVRLHKGLKNSVFSAVRVDAW